MKGEILEQVILLAPDEAVRLNPDQLGQLYMQLGETGAEDIVCRAMEELANRLELIEIQFRKGAFVEMRKNVRAMVAISEQVGMQSLSNVAEQVLNCVDENDSIALAATVARLMRIGERSFSAIWELQDLSV
ncbi:MAG: hypothetical protein JXR13_01260 [Thalassovita sp.]